MPKRHNILLTRTTFMSGVGIFLGLQEFKITLFE